MYTLHPETGTVIRDSDQVVVTPIDEPTEAYLEYKIWLEAGNVPTIHQDSSEEIEIRNLENIRLLMWENIKAERERRKYSGVKVGDHWFHSDPDSRTQQMALVLLGDNIPPGLQWKTLTPGNGMENLITVAMTKDLAKNIFSSILLSDTMLHAISENHRTNMVSSEDPNGYNYRTGWPLSFEEATR